eukprot:g8168.t2
MLSSSMTRAGRRFASASACSQLRPTLPGAYREPTELWHHDKRDGSLSEVETMKSEADLKNLLASAEADSLVVVKFHAIMCAASKAIEGKFERTAAEFGDMDGQEVTFADVCFDSNRQLCEKMGIRSVPHVQIFSGANGKVADFSIDPLRYDTLTSLLAERRDSVDFQYGPAAFNGNEVVPYFDGNAGGGGAVAVADTGKVAFHDFAFFYGNKVENGDRGGAMENLGEAYFWRASYFMANIAGEDGDEVGGEGGAIYTEEGSTTTFKRRAIHHDNMADNGGGALWNEGATMLMSNAILKGNSAMVNGGMNVDACVTIFNGN